MELEGTGDGRADSGNAPGARRLREFEKEPEDIPALRERFQEFLNCIELSSDGFCIMDADTTVLYANRVYEAITGLKRGEIIGHTMRSLVKRGIFDKSVAEQILATGKAETLALKLSTGKSLLCSGNPLFDERNRIRRIVCSVRDITELNRMQAELDSIDILKARYEEELVDLKRRAVEPGNLIFRSVAMSRIVDLALRVASADSTILLCGESGSGKELLADFIQQNSRRAAKPFLKINCGAIPEPLLESELFGYVRGAFTGADRYGKIGLFEAANQGTLLLDEVGDLPRALQVKLLRVLQERSVRRLGDTISRPVDVRIIASTNRDLSAMTKSGDFRQDLFYRLNVIPVTIPPLRERKEDILPMIRSFLERFSKLYGTPKSLHPQVTPLLLAYSWPGNVRELENIIERIFVTSSGTTIDTSNLPEELLQDAQARLEPGELEGKGLKELLDDYESKILRYCFQKYRTTRDVAQALGIHQSNVVRKLQRLRLEDLPERGRRKRSEQERNQQA